MELAHVETHVETFMILIAAKFSLSIYPRSNLLRISLKYFNE